MDSIAAPIRTHRTLETFASILALLALAAYVVAHVFLPLPLNQWIAGMICFTSDRVASGGHYYQSPESLCGATFPYPPGSLFLHHWVTTLTGLDPLLATRLLAILLTALYAVLCVRVALRLGTRFAFAASSFALICFALSLHVSYGGGMTLAGDVIVLACAMAIVLQAPALEQFKSSVPVAMLLALAFVFKAQGASLYAGVVLFLMNRPQVPFARKLYKFSCIGVGLLVVVALLLSMAKCWESCVETLSRHPRSARRLVRELAESKYLWPFGILPVVLLVLNRKLVSLLGAWHTFQRLPASTAMLLCLALPYTAIQAAAVMKNGGGAYNLELAVMLAAPLFILVLQDCRLDCWPVVVLFAVVSIAGLSRSALEVVRQIPREWRFINDSRAYLTSKYPNAVVLYSADQYCLIGNTSLKPATDVLTVWHYLTASYRLDHVKDSVESQYYDLLIYPGLFGNSVPFVDFDRLLREKYVPVEDGEVPAYLRGGLFVRRPTTR